MTWSRVRTLIAVLALTLLAFPLAAQGFPLAAQGIDQEELPENHLLFSLNRSEDGFQGSSEQLPGFEIAMVVEPGEAAGDLDLDTLMDAIRDGLVSGTLTYPNGRSAEIGFEIVEHRGSPEVYMKSRLGFCVWEQARVSPEKVAFVIDFWYTPPAVEADLKAIQLATKLLQDPANWLRDDDRRCESEQWSLFCALKYASTETLGEYNHHSKATNEVREAIYERCPGEEFAHVLMDFNNADTTTHDDILMVLRTAEERIAEELASPE